MQCQSSTICTKCENNKYLQNVACLDKCEDGFYPKKSDSTCDACDKSCKKCTGPSLTDCTECNADKNLNNGECVNCQDGFYFDTSSSTCKSNNLLFFR